PNLRRFSVAAADLNVDGRPDLLTANLDAANISVSLSSGNGVFQGQLDTPAGASPYSIAAGDLDKDGKPDVVVALHGAGGVLVYHGSGNGALAPPTMYPTDASPYCVTIADLDADKSPEVIVANEAGTVSVLRGMGNGKLGNAV